MKNVQHNTQHIHRFPLVIHLENQLIPDSPRHEWKDFSGQAGIDLEGWGALSVDGHVEPNPLD